MRGKKAILCIGYIIVATICIVSIALLFFSRNKNESEKSKRTIGALYMTMNNPYFEVINEEIKAVVESKGDVLETRDSGMDALIYNRSFVDGTVVSNNYQAGEQCAKDLMKRRKKGKILFLVQSENKSAIDRIKGFKETLEKAGWKYENVGELECQGQLELSQPLVEKVLNKTKDIDVVMALNDPSAMGAMAALDAEHMLSDVLVYGADGSPEAKTMIYENKMAATSAQSPRTTGKKTVEMLYKILDGKKTEKQCIVPVSLITKDNINDYSLSGWQ